jgi:hypothetical protein
MIRMRQLLGCEALVLDTVICARRRPICGGARRPRRLCRPQGALRPSPLTDGAHLYDRARTQTHPFSSWRAYERRCNTAPHREGRARLTSIRAPTFHAARAPIVPAHDQERTPHATIHGFLAAASAGASLLSSSVLREPVVLDLDGSLLHRPTPRRALRPAQSPLATTSPADPSSAVHGRLWPKGETRRRLDMAAGSSVQAPSIVSTVDE